MRGISKEQEREGTRMLVECRELKKVYGKGELAVEALKGVSFGIEEGKFYAIIGKSGSGKSTLLQLLGALDKASSGEIRLEGEAYSTKSDEELALLRRRRLGYVFQSFNLLPEYTVEENIIMPLLLDAKEVEKEYFEEIIQGLDLGEKRKAYPDELSGGQIQRVAIARALVTRPAMVLADEPTGNLDEKTGRDVLRLIKRFQRRFSQTVILVTHDMDIAAMADHIIEIVDGEIVSIK